MEGAHDMGGVPWSGPVVPEPDEPMFHAEWERRAFAITLAMGMPGGWNIDMSRFARENRPPEDYLSKSYYQIWLAGLERLMLERGLITADEIEAAKPLHPTKPVARTLTPDGVAAMLHRGGPTEREAKGPALFAIGDRVRTKIIHPPTHTRLPRYVRGHVGTIELLHGCPCVSGLQLAGPGKSAMALYRELRRPRIVGRGRRCLGEDFGRCLGILSGAGLMAIDPQAALRATSAVPSIPRDQDGPVFREPWEAQAFAMALALHARGLFTWNEWAQALADEIKRAQAAGDADTGETYYRHWLATLEKLVAAKGVANSDTLHRYRDAWDHAADRTPHGSPIVLRPEDFGTA